MQKETTKIVYFGTPDFAIPPLAALLNDPEFKIEAVVTQEDKKTGRKQILTPPPVKVFAIDNDITVFQPPKVRKNDEFIELIKGLTPDFLIVTAYGQILPQDILDIPKITCLNIHGSLLPHYRGASPIEEALIKGEKETGISFMQMTEKLDAGPVYQLQRMAIDETDNAITLRDKLSTVAALQLPSLLKEIKEGAITPIEQDDSLATYCHKIKKEDGMINFETMTAKEIENKIRAYRAWPQCHFRANNKTIKILEGHADRLNTDTEEKSVPKKLYEISKDKIGIGTKEGVLIPEILQPEGKNPMKISDFLRGNHDMLLHIA